MNFDICALIFRIWSNLLVQFDLGDKLTEVSLRSIVFPLDRRFLISGHVEIWLLSHEFSLFWTFLSKLGDYLAYDRPNELIYGPKKNFVWPKIHWFIAHRLWWLRNYESLVMNQRIYGPKEIFLWLIKVDLRSAKVSSNLTWREKNEAAVSRIHCDISYYEIEKLFANLTVKITECH